ncbi:hypothetical protein T440DRAFT_468654 [Plenodomus tracheiphilus IPT5]|uniref:Uncharacterized protein n=1 Tax=Plenodomus tracheiphilus IPT5 TaxID=1408161 RepID=A0A6A7B4V8_9PLEO|nr:hypothetical protein T440DRAFT_468654 [Plenodomus tracheiphilus IPT5]
MSSSKHQQARLAQSVARETLNLKVVGSSPTSGSFFLSIQIPGATLWVGDILGRIWSCEGEWWSVRPTVAHMLQLVTCFLHGALRRLLVS